MGAAESSNVSNAIANVCNSVQQSTNTTADQVSSIKNTIENNSCSINLKNNYNVDTLSTSVATNQQIATATQDSNVKNNIAQQMMQTATSTVGSLGIGYASASNSATTMVNLTNQIVNTMNVSASQYAQIDNSFVCNGSTINANNLNVIFESTTDLLSTQITNNGQVANITNDITQDITQSATATVEGLSGLLMMILFCIAVLVYVLMKPLSSGAITSAVGIGLCAGLVIFVCVMYVAALPPFFNEPKECLSGSDMGLGSTNDKNVSCGNYKLKKIFIKNPPIKYIYAITPNNHSESGTNLMQMAIAASSQSPNGVFGSNGGYNGQTYNILQTEINVYSDLATKLHIPNIPNPLYLPRTYDASTGYNDNTDKPYFSVPAQYSSDNISSNFSCTPSTIQVGTSTVGATSLDKKCPVIAQGSCWNKNMTTSIANDINTLANLNIDAWNLYLNDSTKTQDELTQRSLFARFVLSSIIGVKDLHLYVNDNDIVQCTVNGIPQPAMTAADAKAQNFDVYFYHPYGSSGNWNDGLSGSGYINGNVGVVMDNTYTFENFMKTTGWKICLGLVCFTLAYLILSKSKVKNPDNKLDNKLNNKLNNK